jgi:hypothetical protein
MEFYLQFGYGMMAHSRELVERWGGGTVVLSPRDLSSDQITRLSAELTGLDATVLIDPQLYLPHKVHERLAEHEYWPADYDSGMFWTGAELKRMLGTIKQMNDEASTGAIVLPGILATRIDEDWFSTLQATFEEADRSAPDANHIGTLAIGADAMRSAEQIGTLIEQSESWSPETFYLVCEHPDGDYLVSDPVWLANLLDLIAGLRLGGKKVILGYCQHQMLIAACAKVTAIASGTWMNVRSFPPEKFETKYDEEMKQRTTWYYCPQALSEYKIPFLDMAQRARVLNRMRPSHGMDAFVTDLFEGPQPTTVGFTEQQAFRHYLDCLRSQALEATKSTFDATVEHHQTLLDEAETLLGELRAAGVNGQKRDMSNDVVLDASRAAIEDLKRLRGAVLRRKWAGL